MSGARLQHCQNLSRRETSKSIMSNARHLRKNFRHGNERWHPTPRQLTCRPHVYLSEPTALTPNWGVFQKGPGRDERGCLVDGSRYTRRPPYFSNVRLILVCLAAFVALLFPPRSFVAPQHFPRKRPNGRHRPIDHVRSPYLLGPNIVRNGCLDCVSSGLARRAEAAVASSSTNFHWSQNTRQWQSCSPCDS